MPDSKQDTGRRTFEEFDLPQELMDAVDDLGFTACTPVQGEVLPHALDGEDIIGQAQTGTGKTAAFLITIIAYQLENPELTPRPGGTPFALIVAPTRELVMQIAQDGRDLTKHTDVRVLSVVGGIDYEKQRRACRDRIDILVATPGRLLDFCRSSVIHLDAVEILVLDEADRMLDMGFIPDVKAIIRRTPPRNRRQTMLFSATLSRDVRNLAGQWTIDPVEIEIEPEQIAVDTVEQVVYLVAQEDKYKVLRNLLRTPEVEKAIVFANRRDQTRDLEQKLRRDGFETALLAGDVPQRKRMQTLEAFKAGRIRVLVATDVAGRGIHVDDVSHVINYTLPEDPEDYVHRIGRTGRAGATGKSISFACEMDAFLLPGIEELLGDKLECVQPEEALMNSRSTPS